MMNRIWISNLLKATVSLFLFFSLIALTAERANAQSSGPKFTAGAMFMLGQGKMGNGSTVSDVSMSYTPITGFVGYNIKKFRLGAQFEYMMSGQSDDPAGFANKQNLSGTGTGMGLRLEFYDGKQAAGLVYRMSDTYNLSKPTSTGASVSYKGSGGMSLQYYRQIKKRFGIVFDYTTETYKDSTTPDPVKWNRMAIGVVFTNFANSK